MTDLPKFGRYLTVAKLGGGAAGDVYRAHDELLGRDVAVKTLRAAGRNAVLSTERFFHEARAVGAVSHPGVIRIFDMGEQDGTPYLVMELATGGSLADRLEKQPRPTVDEVCAVGIQIAGALAAAHARGILHRDVKPGNIVRDADGAWKLADFGVAHVPDSTLTLAGQFLGSPAYAAPESLEAGEFGHASDVYGLAATLHEALTGAPPFGDQDYAGILATLQGEARVTLAERSPALPKEVAAILDRALSRRPAERPSAAQLADALAARDGVPVAVAPVAMTPVRVAAPAAAVAGSRRPLLIGLGAIVAVGLIAAVVASSGGGSKSAPPVRRPVIDAAGGGRPVVPERDHVQAAVQKMQRGDWAGAKKDLEQALEEDPRDEYAHDLLDDVERHLQGEHEEDEEREDDEGFVPPGQRKKLKKEK